ncbi:MAG: rhomboid family intramembrane serine protease [Nocardiopsaceae bacterium]|nr:rhomboid family intramembrane serine protease [Nocardiopsaceae bacterium]
MSVRKVRDAAVVMAAFLALIWIVQVLNWADGYRLDSEFGILPHQVGRLGDIFTAPFLHVSWQHIEGNSIPLFVLGFLAAYRGIAKFLLVTLIVAVTSGIAVWLFQSNGLTVGASGIIFGYFGYVMLRGIFDRNLVDIGVGILAAAMYWGILSVAIPGTPGVSWIAHLGGLVGGMAAAWVLRSPQATLLPRRGQATGITSSGTADAGRRADAGGAAGSGRGSRAESGVSSGSGGAYGSGGAGRDGQTRPLGSTDADELLRKIDEMGI